MITKIILRFENLDQEQEHKALDWLTNCEEKKEIPFKFSIFTMGEIIRLCQEKNALIMNIFHFKQPPRNLSSFGSVFGR